MEGREEGRRGKQTHQPVTDHLIFQIMVKINANFKSIQFDL